MVWKGLAKTVGEDTVVPGTGAEGGVGEIGDNKKEN